MTMGAFGGLTKVASGTAGVLFEGVKLLNRSYRDDSESDF